MIKIAPLPLGILCAVVLAIAWKCYHLKRQVEWRNVAKSYDIHVGTDKMETIRVMGSPDEVVPNGLDSTYRYLVPLTTAVEILISFDSLQRVAEVSRQNHLTTQL
ncbi:hypothetical protein FKX85_20440 [Echinicola soli]|uniref:Uncharacterized protein n=1 Tax=Echinicola soli TaxID=2591634 RepID=A0A514CN90_9BACT|nr:hypothetical protein [Echinicola soli]QDH81271.1 hypothetical protein FKX85_20440 [Echinicola soli]